MDKKNFKIVFMGTPEFAVEPLKTLIDKGFNIVSVVTSPDKPAGRGHKLQYSHVKEYAMEHQLPILQPEKLKDEVFLADLRALDADLFVVVAFRMLPKVVWEMPRRGTINLHASLLPQYRGAAPINWAVIHGESLTGVTTFFIEEEIDTGMIIDQQSINIDPDENVGSVYSRLQHLGSCVLAETVQGIMEGTISPVPQDTRFTHASDLRPAPKISKQTCQISWNKTAREVHNLVRGFSPYPAAWTYIGLDNQQAEMVKIYATRPIIEKHVLAPGTIITDAKSFLNIATLDGYISVMEIQPAAKKKMDITAYLNGHHIDNRSKAF